MYKELCLITGDRYHWTPGNMAFTPEGVIHDNDAILRKLYRGAKEFNKRSNYSQNISGGITVRKWWFDKNNYY